MVPYPCRISQSTSTYVHMIAFSSFALKCPGPGRCLTVTNRTSQCGADVLPGPAVAYDFNAKMLVRGHWKAS